MGHFRRYKLRDQTIEGVEILCANARTAARSKALGGCSNFELDEAMTEWACYRELLARLQNKNRGREE